jgi:transposase
MKKHDGRKLDAKTLEQIRTRAVQRVQDGESPEVVVKALGFARACIYNWLARYRAGGWHALKSGRASGRPRTLAAQHMRWVYKTVSGSDPRQLNFPFALWTRAIIRRALYQQFGIRLSESSVGRLLKQLGFSCQRPLYRAYQQDPEAVERWQTEEFPRIKAEAKQCKAAIYFEDESGLRSDFHSGRSWALRGQTPVIRATGARFGLNMISAISTRGLLRFMLVAGSVGAEQVCEFLNRLMYKANRAVFLIWDGHPVHRSKKVRQCVESFQGKLRVFYMPSYSPELNPAEQVWTNVKSHGVGRQVVLGPDQLKTAVLGCLRRLQKLPKLIRSFFSHPECAYVLC